MELYNLIRLPIVGPIKVFSRKAKNARLVEKDLHDTFDIIRFKQSPARAVLKEILRIAFFVACWYRLTKYPHIYERAESVNDVYLGILAAYFMLFWGEVKIGISRDSDNRLEQIRDDLRSGRTEWFRMPWPVVPVILFASAFLVRAQDGHSSRYSIDYRYVLGFIFNHQQPIRTQKNDTHNYNNITNDRMCNSRI